MPATTDDDGIFSLGTFDNQLTGVITVGGMLDDGVEAQAGVFTNNGTINLDLSGATLAGNTGLSIGSNNDLGNFTNNGTIEVISGSNSLGTALVVFPGLAAPFSTFTNNGMVILNDGNPARRFLTRGITVNGPTGTINTGTGRINVSTNTFRNNGLIVSSFPGLPGVTTGGSGTSLNDGFFRTNSSLFSDGGGTISNLGINMNDPAQTTFNRGGACTVTIGGPGATQFWKNVSGTVVGGQGPNLSFMNAFPDISSATINAVGIDVSMTLTNLCAAALPIELTSFTAVRKEKTVMLEWETAGEVNNDYMAVERSGDARFFTEIGKVAGAGNSNSAINYELEDTVPLSGINYYRLRQVDYDGTTNYSKIISVTFNGETGLPTVALYPNVVKSGESMEIDLLNFPQQQMTFRILNSQGQIVNNFSLAGGTRQSFETGNLAAGVYFLISTNSSSRTSTRFVVTN
jgi:hypothetical protein